MIATFVARKCSQDYPKTLPRCSQSRKGAPKTIHKCSLDVPKMLTRGRKCSQGCAKMLPRCLRGVQNAARLSKNAPTMLPRPPRCSQDASEARFGHPKRSPRASLRSSLEAFWVRKSSKLSRGAPKMPPRPPRCRNLCPRIGHFSKRSILRSILEAFWEHFGSENQLKSECVFGAAFWKVRERIFLDFWLIFRSLER